VSLTPVPMPSRPPAAAAIDAAWNGVCNVIARMRSPVSRWPCVVASLLCLAVAPVVQAQDHHHGAGGDVSGEPLPFASTCRPAVAGVLDRGVHQLHTLALDDAIGTFRLAAHSDIDCTMAYWGTAMTHWARFARSGDADVLAEGWRALDQAALLHRAPSARERRYLDALVSRYRLRLADGPRRYAAAMAALATDFPDDPHAAWFAAAARLDEPAATVAEATAAGDDALALLHRPAVPAGHVVTRFHVVLAGRTTELAARVAEHARVLAGDDEAPARLLPAARRVFEALGRWPDAIALGQRLADAARRDGAAAEELLALEGLVLAQLQASRADEARAVERRLDGGYLADAADAAAVRARIGVRIALDTDDMAAAAALAAPDDAGPAAVAAVLFARALGAAALGRPADAAAAARRLEALTAVPGTAPATTRLARAATAWAAAAAGRRDAAVAALRALADEEDAVFDDGQAMPLRPAREQLADLLTTARRLDEAAAAYAAVLERWPGRARAAARLAARAKGDDAR